MGICRVINNLLSNQPHLEWNKSFSLKIRIFKRFKRRWKSLNKRQMDYAALLLRLYRLQMNKYNKSLNRKSTFKLWNLTWGEFSHTMVSLVNWLIDSVTLKIRRLSYLSCSSLTYTKNRKRWSKHLNKKWRKRKVLQRIWWKSIRELLLVDSKLNKTPLTWGRKSLWSARCYTSSRGLQASNLQKLRTKSPYYVRISQIKCSVSTLGKTKQV